MEVVLFAGDRVGIVERNGSRFALVPGDTVVYRTFGGGLREAEIVALEADIKNGRPGFDAACLDATGGPGGAVWGYSDQLVSINGRALE